MSEWVWFCCHLNELCLSEFEWIFNSIHVGARYKYIPGPLREQSNLGGYVGCWLSEKVNRWEEELKYSPNLDLFNTVLTVGLWPSGFNQVKSTPPTSWDAAQYTLLPLSSSYSLNINFCTEYTHTRNSQWLSVQNSTQSRVNLNCLTPSSQSQVKLNS